MDDTFAATLGVAESVAKSDVESRSLASGPHFPREFAEKLYAYESLQSTTHGPRDELPEPYSLQWFLDIEKQRLTRQGRWIPKALEFGKHVGERLLGLGHGLGTDWVQYAQCGASVIVCTPSPMQLRLVRRNFELRQLPGRFINADPTRLPLESNSIDVALLSSLYHGIDNPRAAIEEVYRVLKPGGKILAVTSARRDVDFWFHTVFFWYRWFATEPEAVRKPAPEHCYTPRQLRRLFAQFIEGKVVQRQLRRSEIPYVWRCFPTPLLSRVMGRILVLKAFKPVRELR